VQQSLDRAVNRSSQAREKRRAGRGIVDVAAGESRKLGPILPVVNGDYDARALAFEAATIADPMTAGCA